MKKIAIIAEYDPSFEPHVATERALTHSAAKMNVEIEHDWISTNDLDGQLFVEYQGIWVGPGSPYKNMAKTICAASQKEQTEEQHWNLSG